MCTVKHFYTSSGKNLNFISLRFSSFEAGQCAFTRNTLVVFLCQTLLYNLNACVNLLPLLINFFEPFGQILQFCIFHLHTYVYDNSCLNLLLIFLFNILSLNKICLIIHTRSTADQNRNLSSVESNANQDKDRYYPVLNGQLSKYSGLYHCQQTPLSLLTCFNKFCTWTTCLE